MSNQLIETIERFTKNEFLPKIERIEKAEPESEFITDLLEKTSEIGLNLLPLPEEEGGIGLNIPLIGKALMKMAEINAGISTIYLFHYAGMFPFLMNENGAKLIREIMRTNPDCLLAPLQSSYLPNITGVKYLSVYKETNAGAFFSILPVHEVEIIEKGKNLGLRPLCYSSVNFEKIKIGEKNSIRISVEEGEKLSGIIKYFIDIMLSAIAVGNVRTAYRHAINYATERYQGGDILINHSIIQVMLGRILARISASSAYCEKILQDANNNNYTEAGIAKAFITECCEWACSDCVQIFGGYGYMKDFHVERHLRDAKSLCAISGGNMFKVQEYIKNLMGVKQ